MMTQVSAPPPTKDPLTTRDRQIIATIVNESDYSHECKSEDVVTIWINSDDIVWVKMTHGYARYHKESFKRAVAEVKESLSTPLERNQKLDDELKEAANTIGLLGDCDWLSLSIKAYSDKLVGFAGCYTSQKPQILTPSAEWDFTPLKWNMPAAICPDCGGHGCGNCSYRGTRAEDLCTPVDGYRLTYVGRTDLQTAENVYLDGEFLGIVFKVRNPNEVWENDLKTYYWRCGDGVQYWGVREAVEALRRVTTPVELPRVSRELVTQTELTRDDQELIMNLTQAYEEARAQAVQEGVQQGVQQGVQLERRQVVENLLRIRFSSVDEELSKVVDSLLQLTPDEFARVLLELSTLSREELLARFNSHQ